MSYALGMRGRHFTQSADHKNGCPPRAAVEAMETRQLLSVVNGGFEAGDVSGWAHVTPAYGAGASVVTSYEAAGGPAYSAAEGASFALLPTAIGGRATTLSQDFRAAAGDTISGWAFFDNANWADQDTYGAVTIKAGTQTVATLFRADAASTGDFGQTPWTPFSYTFTQAGNYRIEAAAKDVFEAQNTSYLGFDGVVFSGARDPGQPQLLDMNPTDNGTEEGSPIEFNGVFQDATYGDSHQVVVDWGDGTQSTLLPVSGAADVSTGLVNPANGHVYYRLSEYVSWADGEARAQQLGGHLITINDAAEQEWAWQNLLRPRRAEFMWLGLNDTASEGNFVWSSGQTPGYTKWQPGEPDDKSFNEPGADYGAMSYAVDGAWVDTAFPFALAVVEVDHPIDFGGKTGNIEGAPYLTAFGAEHVYRDQPASGLYYPIAATVTDAAGLSSTATSSILVSDATPTASIDGPFSGVAGETLHYAGSVSDPGDLDTVTPAWEVRDNATGLVVATGSALTFDFTPTTPGSYAVMLSATDDEGATGYAYGGFGSPLTVDQVQVRPDATDPSKSVLAIGGTTKNDNIVLRPDGSGGVRVLLNGASAGVFSPTGSILVYGQAGNDRVSVDSGLGVQVTFFGGDGNDILSSDSATDLLVGGAGHDRVLGTARLID